MEVLGKAAMGVTEDIVARLALQLRLTQALDRLITLYTALDKPDEVKKWQTARAK